MAELKHPFCLNYTMLKHHNLSCNSSCFYTKYKPAYVFITTNLKKIINRKGKKLRIYNNSNEQFWGGLNQVKSSTFTNSLIKSNYFITLVCTAALTWWCDLATPVTLCLMYKKHLSIYMMHWSKPSASAQYKPSCNIRMHDRVAPKQAQVACIRKNTLKQLCNTARWTLHNHTAQNLKRNYLVKC